MFKRSEMNLVISEEEEEEEETEVSREGQVSGGRNILVMKKCMRM